jgi:hypothetical protein
MRVRDSRGPYPLCSSLVTVKKAQDQGVPLSTQLSLSSPALGYVLALVRRMRGERGLSGVKYIS